MQNIKINLGTQFKIEWAEGRKNETDKYVGKTLSLSEFAYIITKRHHEIVLDNISVGFYSSYDKHKVLYRNEPDGEWELFGRLDLGDDEFWAECVKALEKAIDDNIGHYYRVSWSGLVAKGLKEFEKRGEDEQ